MAGVVSAGLYTALMIFPPPAGKEVALNTPTPPPVIEETAPPIQNIPSNVTAPPPMQPPSSQMDEPDEPESPPELDIPPPPRPRPFSMMTPGGMTGRSDKFREARRAMFQDGKQPDFNQFEGREREALEKMWERYQRGMNNRGGGPGIGPGGEPGQGPGGGRGGRGFPPFRNR